MWGSGAKVVKRKLKQSHCVKRKKFYKLPSKVKRQFLAQQFASDRMARYVTWNNQISQNSGSTWVK